MRAALVAALAIGSSCVPRCATFGSASAAAIRKEPPAPAPAFPAGISSPIVLVTIDGARWQEIFQGSDPVLSPAARRWPHELTPNLHRLAHERGAAVGAPGRGRISATGPNFVSLPGYTEILTGRAPSGCHDNGCKTTTSPTLLDDAHSAGASVAAFGSWEMLDRAISWRPGAFPVSCGRSPAETQVDPWPGSGNFRPDRLTAELALHHLETSRPDLLYVGLGEPDEYAHRGNYEGYLRSLAYADAVVGRILDVLDRMGTRGAQTHVFVTADHGRARDFKGHGGSAPESARVWLIAAGPSISARGSVASPRDRHLSDVAPTLRVLMGLTPDREREGMRGVPLDELAQVFTPIGQATPVPPSPQ